MRIIPAIDIINGKCVRLSQGDYSKQKVYNNSPVEVAKSFEDIGIKYLHVVDLDGAKANKIMNANILESICTQTNLTVDFGGGIKSIEDAELAFDSGASQITGGSIAVKKPELFEELISKFGAEKILLGADCFEEKIATQGWTETSEIDVFQFIEFWKSKGIKTTIVTDISKDGMLEGPSFGLYRKILKESPLQLIASGGVESIEDIFNLREIGCEGVIIGKAIYEGRIKLKQLRELC